MVMSFAASPADSQVIGVYHLLKILDEGEIIYILVGIAGLLDFKVLIELFDEN